MIKAGAAASFLVCGAVFIFDSSPEKPDHDSTVQAYDECFPDMKKVSLRDNLSNEELVQALTGLAVDQDKNNVKWILRAFEAKIAPEQIIQEYFNEKSQPRFLRGLASEKRILEIGYHYYEVLSIAYGPAIAEMLLGFQFTGITTEELSLIHI